MASGNLVKIVYPIPSAIERLRQNPPKLHPRVAKLKTKRNKMSLAKIKWHGKVDPGFRLVQAQRKGSQAKEYLTLSRKVLGLKIHRMEEYGKLHGLPMIVYKCIIKYRTSEHLMECLDAQEDTRMGGDLEGEDGGAWPIFEGSPTDTSSS
jgi:hypothetical protein